MSQRAHLLLEGPAPHLAPSPGPLCLAPQDRSWLWNHPDQELPQVCTLKVFCRARDRDIDRDRDRDIDRDRARDRDRDIDRTRDRTSGSCEMVH